MKPSAKRTVVPMLLLMFLPFAGTAQVMQFHRFSSNVGLSGGFWTNDNGKHWKEIAWPDGARTVFFLTPTTGWVLITQDSGEENPSFALGTTHDSGATWSVTPIRVPVSPKECMLPGEGHLQFTDEMHGWVNLMVQSGSAFDFGILLKTVDGGKTWVLAGGPGRYSETRFINSQDGWILAEHESELWVTHDGSKTWQQVSLKPPADLKPADDATYLLPVFGDDKHGAVEVAYSGLPTASEDVCHKVLFVTSDGGHHWKFKEVPSKQKSCGGWWPYAASRSVLIAPTISDQKLTLRKVSLNSTSRTTTTTADLGFLAYVDGISFSSPQDGWVSLTACCEAACSTCVLKPSPRVSCTAVANWDRPMGMQCGALLSTDDGGKTWTDITLRQRCVQEGPTGKKTCTVEK